MEERRKVVEDKLKALGFDYKVVEHPETFDTDTADLYIEGHEGCRTKTLFLVGKKKRNPSLFILDEHKEIDLKELGEKVGIKNLHFADFDFMHEVIDLVPGGVSLFGILNDKNHVLSIYIDEDMMKEHDIITFLPNVNTATVFIKKEDMLKFIESEGYKYEILNM